MPVQRMVLMKQSRKQDVYKRQNLFRADAENDVHVAYGTIVNEIKEVSRSYKAVSYTHLIEVNGMVYTSGIIPVVPETGEIPEGSVAQAKQALTNLSNLLEAAGTNMDNVVKTTVFIKEMNDFSAINDVYKTFFTTDFPSRSCVEVARLPKDVMLEIEAIAIK